MYRIIQFPGLFTEVECQNGFLAEEIVCYGISKMQQLNRIHIFLDYL